MNKSLDHTPSRAWTTSDDPPPRQPGYEAALAKDLEMGAEQLDEGKAIPAEQVWTDLDLEGKLSYRTSPFSVCAKFNPTSPTMILPPLRVFSIGFDNPSKYWPITPNSDAHGKAAQPAP